MGRLTKLDTENQPESVLAPADNYRIPCAPTLTRLRALKAAWKQEEQTIQERMHRRLVESVPAEMLRGYTDLLASLGWTLQLVENRLLRLEDVPAYAAEIELHLLALVTLARKHLSDTRAKYLSQERYDTRARLSIELLTALEDFS